MAIQISSTYMWSFWRSVNVVAHLTQIESQETSRMSFMYCGRMMLEIKLRAVPMLSKCQVSSFVFKGNSE